MNGPKPSLWVTDEKKIMTDELIVPQPRLTQGSSGTLIPIASWNNVRSRFPITWVKLSARFPLLGILTTSTQYLSTACWHHNCLISRCLILPGPLLNRVPFAAEASRYILTLTGIPICSRKCLTHNTSDNAFELALSSASACSGASTSVRLNDRYAK